LASNPLALLKELRISLVVAKSKSNDIFDKTSSYLSDTVFEAYSIASLPITSAGRLNLSCFVGSLA